MRPKEGAGCIFKRGGSTIKVSFFRGRAVSHLKGAVGLAFSPSFSQIPLNYSPPKKEGGELNNLFNSLQSFGSREIPRDHGGSFGSRKNTEKHGGVVFGYPPPEGLSYI